VRRVAGRGDGDHQRLPHGGGRGPSGKLKKAARAIYERVDEAELAAFGFKPEDYGEWVEIWPENWDAVTLFRRMTTQWRMSMGGPTGLDYNVLFRLLDNERLSGDDWDLMLTDVSVMEAAALEAMAQK
jgi:hypothetical protein